MTTPRPTVLTALLLSVPLLSHAQATEPVPQPKFYVGLAAYHSGYQRLGTEYGRSGFNLPVQATFGYQLRPRLAVQVGLAYRGTSFSYDYINQEYLGRGRYGPAYEANIVQHYRTFSASALARYTLTRQAAHRLQFDVLGGLTLEHLRSTARYTRTDSAAAPVTSTERYHSSQLLVTVGPGLRYRFGQRLEATYNLLLNYGITGYTYASPLYSDRFTGSMALGVQYRFGR